ncbi:MAG TPA: maltotransferase domain-containing protein, partial [Polyangiaceae bacterium]
MSSETTSSPLPRVVIEQVTPELDGGRYPIKRPVGASIDVSAAIFKDGHDQILADVVVMGPGGRDLQRAPLTYRFEPDRWYGQFRVTRPGRWRYWIEAWPDHYGTWRADLEKRLAAGQDVLAELLEGARILARHGASSRDEEGRRLREISERLGDPKRALEERLSIAFSPEVFGLTRGPAEPEAVTRFYRTLEILADVPEASFSSWYELFPRSQTSDANRHGTFADTQRRLPELAALGFDVLYLPPIHPIGETHRKGRNNSRKAEPGDVGSPWAIGSRLGG